MKKAVLVFMLFAACVLLASCAASSADTGAAPTEEPQVVELDLSRLSGTVVYSQVYNMMYEPQNYIGKVIRIAGYYSAYEDTVHDVVYHACVIPDATACCTQGIEFVWKGEHQWPDDYPEEGTDIIVTGRVETYEEDDGFLYLHLVDSDLTWEEESNV